MTYAVTVILCTAVAMVIHELGHLAAARACRVPASEVGLGPAPRCGVSASAGSSSA
jgi:membrane-associated protease RseP (regulator of RpoE activity)